MLVALSGVISTSEFHLPAGTGGSGSSWLAPGTELSRHPVQGAGPQDVTHLTTAKGKNVSQTEMKHRLGICKVLL